MTDPQSTIHNSQSNATYTALSVQPGPGRREYQVTFIQAGRVKGRNQQPLKWEIPDTTLQQAVPLMNGKAVFVDHAEGIFGAEQPSLRNLVGITADATWTRHGAVNGIIRLYDRQDTAWVAQLLDQIVADQHAGRATPDIGLSLVFFASHVQQQRGGDDLKVTDTIHHVESIDLVFGPAANGRVHSALSVGAGLAPAHTVGAGPRACPPIQGASPMPEERALYQVQPGEPDTPQDPPPAPTEPPAISPGILDYLRQMDERISQLATATAALAELQTVRGMGNPPTPQPRARTTLAPATRATPQVTGMWTGLDRLQAAYEHLMGLPARGDFERLTGIRELYMLLSGDRALTGRFNPDLATLAYSDTGNNADTTSMAEITRNVMNKALIAQVNLLQEYRWWERIAYIQDFNSLQQISWVRIGGIGDIPTVAEKGEYTQLAWDDARVAADWVKKGGYLPLSLEMIDRDDVEAWRTVPRQLATSAVVTLSGVVSALFTDNSGIGPSITTEGSTAYAFSSTWGNLITQPLTYENWQTAIETMYKLSQLNVSGRRVAVRPRYLLVPVELEAQGISVVTSDRRPGTDWNDRMPVKRMLPEENVITVPHWTDAENWAALADPNLCPFVGVGFRYGRTPELFTASDPNTHLLFTNDVLPIKVRWIFAASVIDPRGAIKSNA